MNGIRYFFIKKNIIFTIVCIVASIFILVIIQKIFLYPQKFFDIKDFGSINNFSVNMTFENIDGNVVTYNIEEDNIKELNYINYKMGLNFGDDYFFKEYLKLNNISEEQFFQKYGFIRGYHQYKDKYIYLLSKFSIGQNSWNVLIKDKNNYKIFKLADIDDKYSKQNNLSFCLRIDVMEEKICVYLESGLYIIDNNYNVESIKFDSNNIFSELSEENLIPSISRIKYMQENLYIISADKDFNFYLIKYNISDSEFTKYNLNYIPQCIDIANNEIFVLSSNKNKIFIEKIEDEHITYKEITEITNLNLESFMTQTPVNKLIVEKENIYFVFSNNNNKDKAYIFNINANSLKLEGFKEINLKNSGYYLCNTVIFLK